MATQLYHYFRTSVRRIARIGIAFRYIGMPIGRVSGQDIIPLIRRINKLDGFRARQVGYNLATGQDLEALHGGKASKTAIPAQHI